MRDKSFVSFFLDYERNEKYTGIYMIFFYDSALKKKKINKGKKLLSDWD